MDLSKITTYQSGVIQASAYRNLNKLFSALLKEHELSSMQWFIIGTIYDAGPDGIQLSQLATKLQTGMPFVTNTVNMLESKHMVIRTGSLKDSRIKHVSITESFRPTCQQIERNLRAKMRSTIYAEITPEDLGVYIKVLDQLSKLSTDSPL